MILDGWGKSPDPKVSAIDNANVPFINSLYKNYPSAQLRTDGLNVGLPEGQMGNSEVGHMNLGAGRIVYQDLAKINLAVKNHTLKNEKPWVKNKLSHNKCVSHMKTFSLRPKNVECAHDVITGRNLLVFIWLLMTSYDFDLKNWPNIHAPLQSTGLKHPEEDV